MPRAREILIQHDKFLDAVVAAFDEQLGPIVDKAQKKALRALERGLTFAPDGTIEITPANQRTLRSIDRIFRRQMKLAGYDKLVDAYGAQFADHLPKFQDVLNQISSTLETPLPPITFTSKDLDLFASQAIGAKDQLLDLVATAGSAAKRQALFSVGGLQFSDLASELGTQFQKTVSQAKGLADTSTSIFYRTIANQAYKKIEQDLPKGAVLYAYAGPVDGLEREFCATLSERNHTYTREEIDAMDNGQIPGVFTSAGGYCCRHQWILSLGDEKAKAA